MSIREISSVLEENVETISQVLKQHNHPFTIVGSDVQRWMGSRGMIQDTAIDLLLRNEQLISISTALLDSGNWIHYDALEERKALLEENDIPDFQSEWFADYAYEADMVLMVKADFSNENVNYIRLWSEDNYRLSVDKIPWFGIPCLINGNVFLVQEKYFPRGCAGPALISSYNGSGYPVGRVKDNVLLIPGLVPYLDALVYHRTHYSSSKPKLALLAGMQIDNLTRYLYLEQSQCRFDILFEVELETEHYLEKRWNSYKRKLRYTRIGTDWVQVENSIGCKKAR